MPRGRPQRGPLSAHYYNSSFPKAQWFLQKTAHISANILHVGLHARKDLVNLHAKAPRPKPGRAEM